MDAGGGGHGALSEESFRGGAVRACGTSPAGRPLGRRAEARGEPAEERKIIWSSEKGSMVDA